jgi:hypothetical protein
MASASDETTPEFLASTRQLEDFVADWESGRLPRSQWTHAAHVAAMAYYAYLLSPDESFEAMQSGILRFNAYVGIENTDHSGYHETLTRFWWETIGAFVAEGKFDTAFRAVCAAVKEYGNERDRHRSFYRHDIVTDSRARREWIRPST